MAAADGFRAARRNEVAEGDLADQVLRQRSRAAAAADRLDGGVSETRPHARQTNALPSRSYSVPRWRMEWLHFGRYPPSASDANSGGMPT